VSLRRKIFLAFVLIFGLAGTGMVYWVQREARDSYAHVVEDLLADAAQLFAEQIQHEVGETGSLQHLNFAKSFDDFKERKFAAQIMKVTKTSPTLDVYVTDSHGTVLYSSRDPQEAGQDFSQWRDVALTLEGKYGARSTRLDKENKKTSVYYVAAPIRQNGKIAGVVTAVKARASLTTILDYFFTQMIVGVALVILLAVVFAALLFRWITAPIETLKSYALNVSQGKKDALPKLPHRELQQLGDAFEEMRVSVEGRKTIERFVQALIHELKSPLAAVRGAAELSLEPMSDIQREKFLHNILEESGRAERVLQEILGLAALESRAKLTKTETVNLSEILAEAARALIAIAEKHDVTIERRDPGSVYVEGDRFLLTQAVRNVLQNAVEFSEPGGRVIAELQAHSDGVKIRIVDEGCGIPAFAQDKIFEKFFSLERPCTGKKGTGLGLSFVREVIQLHRGRLNVISPPPAPEIHGTHVNIELPATVSE